MTFRRFLRGAAAPTLGVCCALPAFGGTLTQTATDGARAAFVRFEAQGGNLVVTLTNTSSQDVTQPIFVLTGVYFNISGPAVTLTRTSAMLAGGSTVINTGSQPVGDVVGGEWAYKAAINGPRGTGWGISSSGLGLFGPGDLFPGANLDGPADPDGLQFGITSAGDNPATNNGGTNTPLIKNSVVFTLAGLPSGFDPQARISGVNFQYGTSLTEPNLDVPAPGTLGLMGGAGLLASRRRRVAR